MNQRFLERTTTTARSFSTGSCTTVVVTAASPIASAKPYREKEQSVSTIKMYPAVSEDRNLPVDRDQQTQTNSSAVHISRWRTP
jgi:hypothetical protein